MTRTTILLGLSVCDSKRENLGQTFGNNALQLFWHLRPITSQRLRFLILDRKSEKRPDPSRVSCVASWEGTGYNGTSAACASSIPAVDSDARWQGS